MNEIEVVSQNTVSTPPAKAETKPVAEEQNLAAETQDESGTSEESEEVEQEAASQDDVADGEAESDEAEQTDEQKLEAKPKKKSGYQKKIDKLTRRLHEQERELQRLMDEKNVSKDAGTTQPQKAVEQKADGEPQPDQFDSHAAYVKALARFEAKQELKAEKEKQEKAALEQSTQKQVQDYQSRAEKFAEKTEDFWDVMDDVKSIPMSVVLQEEILEHAQGPELLYELAKDPQEFARIAAMPAKAVLKEIWKLEAKLAEKSAPKSTQPKTTKAPPPLTPVAAKASGTAKPLHELDPDEYMKVRRMQMAKAAKG